MRGRGTASVVASPVLVGAVTVLIIVVAVFLAYNANQGLPFVPTYDVNAKIPSGAKLVPGNEVRVGGFRVGLVDEIKPVTETIDGKPRSIAQIRMKLDKTVQPLAADTRAFVRPRSSLGLKYVELTPGKAKQTIKPGDTLELSYTEDPPEYEDVFSTFDEETRENSRTALKGFGDAFAARGQSLNLAIESLNPFFEHLTPVMRTLSDPDTELDEFFKQIGAASAQVAPVAKVQAELFTNMADTFAAFVECEACLQATIEKSPPTMDTAIQSFRVQRPFLADFADLSARLRPVAAVLREDLPTINDALVVGQPVLRRSVRLNELTGDVLKAVDDLAEDPDTLLALKDLSTAVPMLRALIEYVAPYQTVCGNASFFFKGLSEHFSERSAGGTAQRVLLKSAPSRDQDNSMGTSNADRPADVPANFDPQTTKGVDGAFYSVAHLTPYMSAIDPQGNADCMTGQTGFINGPLNPPGSIYSPATAPTPNDANWRMNQAGGSHTSTLNDHPWLSGGTYISRKLGIDNIEDVP